MYHPVIFNLKILEKNNDKTRNLKYLVVQKYSCYTVGKGTVVLQGGSLPDLRKKGGDANEYLRSFNIVNTVRNVSCRIACLHR